MVSGKPSGRSLSVPLLLAAIVVYLFIVQGVVTADGLLSEVGGGMTLTLLGSALLVGIGEELMVAASLSPGVFSCPSRSTPFGTSVFSPGDSARILTSTRRRYSRRSPASCLP